MSDRYTQMAEECAQVIARSLGGTHLWIGDDIVSLDEYLAALLRRVAREQIEEDADWIVRGSTCDCHEAYTSRERIDPSCLYHDMLELGDELRSRAKELED